MAHVFAGLADHYASVFLYERHNDSKGKPIPVRQVLWGDFLTLDSDHPFDETSEWTMVVWSPKTDKQKLRVRTSEVSTKRPLEIVFVDVGQGDGCVLITPERETGPNAATGAKERIMVIDAGVGPHMGEFLEARFKAYGKGFKFHAAVITHPDKDHYYGFKPIFASDKISFDHCYHSGLVERPVSGDFGKLGGKVKQGGSQWWLTKLVRDDAQFRPLYANAAKSRKYDFPNTVRGAIDSGSVKAFTRLAKTTTVDEQQWMPGFEPNTARGYAIEVLGPIVESGPNGAERMRCFPTSPRTKTGKTSFAANYGKTKNGHSVILRLTYGDFSVMFGGDLNRPAEEFLLLSYAGMAEWPQIMAEREEMLALAGPRLRSDVMKTCHHGSADVTDEFLEAVQPAAFVISSGDEEGHVHPRPDLLGRLGKLGRGSSPVLLSTELQRSTRDREDEARVKALLKQVDELRDEADDAARDALRDAVKAEISALCGSNVAVDGAIYVKTDGSRLIAAFKKEQQDAKDRWFYFEYRIVNDRLILVPRDGAH